MFRSGKMFFSKTNKINIFSLYQIIYLVSFVFCVNGKLPSEVEHCKAGDKKCIMKSVNYILENVYMGDPEIGLDSIDPMETSNFNVLNKGTNNAVDIALKFKKAKLYGYRKYRAVKMSGFGKSPEGRHEMFFKGPTLSLVGNYSIDGKILILPIVDEGVANISFSKPELRVRIDATGREANGETYLHIKQMYLDSKIDNMTAKFTGLFKGDKALEETMENFANENWREIYNEIKRPVLDAYTAILQAFLEKVFAHTPYNKILNTSD